ncbi:hypothetical protein Tco_0016760 [Tanacetum coccineum]
MALGSNDNSHGLPAWHPCGFLDCVSSLNMEDDVDINALTIEQYIVLIPDDIKPGIVNLKIGDDVEFKINEFKVGKEKADVALTCHVSLCLS